MFRPLAWVPFLVIALVSLAFYFVVDRQFGMFMIGMITGAVLRIFAYARFTLKAWPITEQVTDWTKVEAMRNETKA